MENLKPISISVSEFVEIASAIQLELQKMMVGQKDIIHNLIVTLIAGGNVLVEGVPGLGKTILVRTLAEVIDCTFNRVQFTPDLMPADIVGTVIISETSDGRRGFQFHKGPLFTNILLADEINRATPRTQSALLEAMQEKQVTVYGETYQLQQPFFVIATQNPIEMEGTYTLPEAQLDRFHYKVDVYYPSELDLIEIARRTTGSEPPKVCKVTDGETLIKMKEFARQVPIEDRVIQYAARLVGATHYDNNYSTESVKRHLRLGASPRGIQAIILSSKVEALMDNRKAVSINDIQKVIYPALRHRLLLSFEAQAESIEVDSILHDILNSVPIP